MARRNGVRCDSGVRILNCNGDFGATETVLIGEKGGLPT